MSWCTRKPAVILGAFALIVFGSIAVAQQIQVRVGKGIVVGPGGQPGQPPGAPPAKGPNGLSTGVDLPIDNDRTRQIEAANDYIAAKRWEVACEVLQKLLMFPEDKMVEVKRPGPDGKEVLVPVSARQEAERLIGTLPPEGMDFYKSSYGPPAKEMLAKAKESGQKEDFGLVMKYYLYTDPGAEATHLLALRQLDRADYINSALCYERLLNREGPDKVAPSVLVEAACAFHLADSSNTKDRVKETWNLLAGRVGSSVKIGEKLYELDELEKQIRSIERPKTYLALADHPMVGGSANRNSFGNGGTAFLERRWLQSLLLRSDRESNSTATQKWLDTADKNLRRRQPTISAFQPITVTINQNGVTKPLVIVRTYSGIEAIDLVTGKIAWDAQSKWGLENMASSSGKMSALQSWMGIYVQNNLRPGIVYENSIIGSLSTDGTYVYAVEDLAVPPPPQFMMNPGFPGGGIPNFGNDDLNKAVQCSELQAFELATNGKLKWTIGGTGKDKPLGDSYFLGPPLPMGGKIYVLTEKQQELRLACIDANTGKVLSTQVLVTTRDKIQTDVGRRTEAAHLAYGEGILVCPTNAGSVLGVDMLTNSLIWAYSYREESANPIPNPGFPNPRLPPGMGGPQVNSTQWKVTPPIVQEGRVVFTAPDAGSVHCLNLRDGTPIWTQKRAEDDLYLGGVYNGNVIIVGKRQTKAYTLSKGELAWQAETGVPGGFGVASGSSYFLPIKESATSKEPEICIIDLATGQLAHTKSREKNGKREVPGTLLFYEGDVISQTETEVVAYPQLEVREKIVTKLLDKDGNDPVGLTDRGELRLDRGDRAGAVSDLAKALDNKPNQATKDKASLKLYEALTEYLQQDFNKAEQFLDRYDNLCKTIDISPDASQEDKDKVNAELRRRQTNFHYLVAKGRQQQGRLVEAFEKYQLFSKLAGTEKLISVPDDLAVRTAPDVWTAARIKAMVDGASPEQRKPLEERISQQWAELQKNAQSLDDIRQFVRLFGSAFAVGKEARLELANRLIESSEPQSLIEAELNLAMLRGGREDPTITARAVETLARLNFQKGLLPDAAFYYRELRDRFPKVVVRDGKTGAQIFADMEANRFILPHLYETSAAALSGRVSKGEDVKPPPNGFPQTIQTYAFDQVGEELPFFKQYRVSLQTNTHNLKITSRYGDETRMDKHLTTTYFQPNGQWNMLNIWNPMGQQVTPKYHYLNMGHLVVLPLGHMVFGIDPVEKKVLWEKNLYGSTNGNGLPPLVPNPITGLPPITVDPRDNSVNILYQDGWMQRIGQATSLEGQVICLQTRDGLVAIDPLTGRTLWTRSDLSAHSQILSDEENFYLVELNAENNPSSTRVLRAQDGVSVKTPDFALLFQKRLRMSGRNLLLSETDDVKKKVYLRLYDVLAGKDLWKDEFPAKSIALQSEDPNLAGVVEPDGKLHVYDLRKKDKKELFTGNLLPKHIEKVHTITLLSDDKDVYVACNGEFDPQLMPWGGIQSNLMPGTGLRSLTVNGEFYSFTRDGELNWHNPVHNQMLVMEHFKEMPVLLFTSRYNKWVNQGAVKNVVYIIAAQSIEKQSGKLKYFNESTNGQQQQFHTLNVDLKGGKIELISWNLKLVHHLLTAGGEKVGDKPADKPSDKPGAKSGAAPSTQEELQKLKEIEKLKAIQEEEAIKRIILERERERQQRKDK